MGWEPWAGRGEAWTSWVSEDGRVIRVIRLFWGNGVQSVNGLELEFRKGVCERRKKKTPEGSQFKQIYVSLQYINK